MTLTGWLYRIIALVGFFCIGMLIGNYFEDQKYKELQQSEINALRKELETKEKVLLHAYDSIAQREILWKEDSVRMRNETEKATRASQREINKLKEIIFIKYANDSLRLKELVNLYPTLNQK